ncbi:ABC transporter substrate-binding protein [Streptomyces sp. NBC_00063]|uniref:ABC transporter substrate-binding protein n=1 Tax=Streptomyces sp. NBC_00063 TaxID=2975638 RepID=UPI00225602F1|nr:ABC transporter substrate-binding protein [Streptomyces sp. NBC_00063]MCX5443820.1 ABC transporter substrate-binding protein [Streptomyces sp. NBC_00063]
MNGSGSGSDPEFFASRPDLVLVARRAARALPGRSLRYLDITGNTVRRVSLDVPDSGRGVVRLDVCDTEVPFGLTVRELEVATCVAGGLGNPEIAAVLACSRRTVATHLEHVFAKLGVRARASVATLIAAEDAYVAPLPSPDLVLPSALLGVLGEQEQEQEPVSRPAVSRAPLRRPAVLASVYPADSLAGGPVLEMRRGARLAVRDISASGGVSGREIDHLAVSVNPEQLLGTVGDLADRGVDGILFGNFPLPVALPALAAANASGTPVLHSMTGKALSERVRADPAGLGAVFQACSTESAYVPGLLRTVRDLEDSGAFLPRRRRLAVLQRASTFDAGVVERVQRQAAEAGWDLVFLESVSDDALDFADVVGRLEMADPDLVSLSVFPEPTLRAFLEAAAGMRDSATFHAAWSPAAPEFAWRLGELSEGLLWSTVIGNVDSPLCMRFEQRFRAMFGADPGPAAAAVHYDMVNVLAQAWSRVSRPWDFAAVREQLRTSTSFGVTGAHQFVGRGQRGLSYPDETRDPARGHPHLIYRITGGANQRLAPPLVS